MTPTVETCAEGIIYLSLGIPDEKYVAPYFWTYPSIAYLDYDHNRRLFMKIMKYPTRDLTMFKDSNGSVHVSVDHLKKLHQTCLDKNIEVRFTERDLLLARFMDMNPEAANKIFTLDISALLDEHMPGSEGTSLYIQAVYHLTEPFFDVSFGTPGQIQESVSTGISILRMWKKYLELSFPGKLHSKTNSKDIKEYRGMFITRETYQTAEILFSAASLHQLALYLHKKEENGRWASPFNSGTQTTEKIIAQMQGKTSQLQSLNAQPSVADVLSKASQVQFNIKTEFNLGSKGVDIPASTSRRRTQYKVKQLEENMSLDYQYPNSYEEFIGIQKEHHLNGCQKAQSLVEKYLPKEFVEVLKTEEAWDLPYKFDKPANFKRREETLPHNYWKLDFSFSKCDSIMHSVPEVENNIDGETDIESEVDETVSANTESRFNEGSVDNSELSNCSDTDDEADCVSHQESKNKKWYIERNGSNMHVNRALKIILGSREYISRDRSKRHWSANYLPDFQPLDPKHDVIKFQDIAIRSTDGFEILNILTIEEDGKNVRSTTKNGKGKVRGMYYKKCALCDENTHCFTYLERPRISKWISVSKIINSVNLVFTSNGHSTLSATSRAMIEEYMKEKINDINDCEETVENDLNPFYEVENVLKKRINPKTQQEEYLVKFQNYSEEENMWLPPDAFHQPIAFTSVSSKGRKRKHLTTGLNTDGMYTEEKCKVLVK